MSDPMSKMLGEAAQAAGDWLLAVLDEGLTKLSGAVAAIGEGLGERFSALKETVIGGASSLKSGVGKMLSPGGDGPVQAQGRGPSLSAERASGLEGGGKGMGAPEMPAGMEHVSQAQSAQFSPPANTPAPLRPQQISI